MEVDKKNEIKLLLLGETDVGKTSIFERFVHNKFKEKISASIGVDFEAKPFKYKNKTYSIHLFDTAGQERFRSIINNFFRMGQGFFVVFDLTNENSLNAVKEWIDTIKEFSEDPRIIILGNKDDLAKKKMPDDIVDSKLENINYSFIKTSAKTNKNIKQAFEKMIDLVENNINEEVEQEKILRKNNSIVLDKTKHKNKEKNKGKQCC